MIMVKLANMAYKVANTEKLKQKRDYDLGRSLAAAILVNPGAGLGVGRASQLTPEEAIELRKYYGLKEKPDLKGRALGRGFGYSMLGSMAGTAAGSVLGIPTKALGYIGGTVASAAASKKYSLGNLQKIRQQEKSI